MSDTKTQKRSVYQIVTDRIIAQLEKSIVPWKQPWAETGLPMNLITKNRYRGINILLLNSLGYEKNFFLTSKQLVEFGARFKKDEKPHMVVFWKQLDEQPEIEDGDGPRKVPFLQYYSVFNVAQCKGIPEKLIPAEISRETASIASCEKIIEHMPNRPVIEHKGNKAFYHPIMDIVNMPKKEKFDNDESYYGTLFHELVHSTGHLSRLRRMGLLEMAEFGSDPYSFEELVAEIGASYLESFSGIESRFEQNVAYIKGWVGVLKNNNRLLVQAASVAQRATDYILNVKREEATEEHGSSDDLPY